MATGTYLDELEPAPAPTEGWQQTGTYLDELPESQRPQLPSGGQARDVALARQLAAPESTEDWMERRAMPFVSSVVGLARERNYHAALQKVQSGTASREEIQTVANYERASADDAQAQQTLGGALGEAAARAPAIAGEAVAGGLALRGLAAAAPALAFLAPAAEGAAAASKVSVPVWAGQAALRTGAQTVLMPSMYVEGWSKLNQDHGRDPLDIRGFPAAFGVGVVNNAILGQLSNQSKILQGPGVGNFLGRQALKGAIGVGEQAAADVGTGYLNDRIKQYLPEWTAKETHYGTLGDLANGKRGQAARSAVVQALTFAAFGIFHEAQEGTPTQQRVAAALATPTGEMPPQGPTPGIEPPTRFPVVAQGPVPVTERGLAAVGPQQIRTPRPEPAPAPPAPVLDALVLALNHLQSKGYSANGAGRHLQARIGEPLAQALQDNPLLSREEARALFDTMPEGPVRDLALAMADAMPGTLEHRPIQTPPALAAPQPQAGPSPAPPTPAAPQAPAMAPVTFAELTQLARGLHIKTGGLSRQGLINKLKEAVGGKEEILAQMVEQMRQPARAPAPQKAATYESQEPPSVSQLGVGPVEIPPREGPPAPEAKPVPETTQPVRSTEEAPAEPALSHDSVTPPAAPQEPARAAQAGTPGEAGKPAAPPEAGSVQGPVETVPTPAVQKWEEILGKSKLNAKEKHVIREHVVNGRSQDDVATDPIMKKSSGEKMGRAGVSKIYRRAMEKLAEQEDILGQLSNESLETGGREGSGPVGGEQLAQTAEAQGERPVESEGQQREAEDQGPGNKGQQALLPEGMHLVGKHKSARDYWDKKAQGARLDRDELHERVKMERQQDIEHRQQWREFFGDLKSNWPRLFAFMRSNNLRELQDATRVPQLDEAADMAQRRMPYLFNESENPSDTLFRLLKRGLPEIQSVDEVYWKVFSQMEVEHANRELKRFGEKPLTPEDLAEIDRVAQAELAREEAGDASFDFGANEPGAPGAATETSEAALPEGPVNTLNQQHLFGGPAKFVGGQSELFGKAETHSEAPPPPKPVDERQQSLFGNESPEGMGTAGGGGQEPPPPPGTPGAAGAATPGGGEPLPASSWFQKAGDWLKSFAQKTFPAVHRLSQTAGEKLAESANAASAARASWDYFSRILKVGGKALGDLTPEERRAVGAVWLERRMRHHREQLRRQGLDAARVGTLIGQEGSPLQTEADYQAGREALWSFWEAIKQEWTPEVEKNYKDVLGLEEADDINSPSQIPGLPLNAIGLTEAAPAQGVVGTGKSQGMGSLRVKKPGFTRAAGLDAAAYDLDIQHMMERTLNLGVPAGRRADFVRTAIAEGVIRKVLPGEKPPEGWKELGLKPAQGLPELETKASYYAHPDAYKDIIQGLGIGERPGQTLAEGVRPIMDKLYGLALMSPVELATHIANHFTALFRAGMGVPLLNLKDSFANAWKVWKQDPEILRRVMELARIGASTHHEARPGLLGESLKAYDPTWYINRFTSTFIDVMQKGVRVQLEDAFERMVKAGYLKGGQANKRDFINQALGNYNSQAGNRLAQFLKDTGLQSFATAAHTFTTQGVKVATGGAINAPATSSSAALQLRAQAMLKLLPLLAIGPVLNYLRFGQSFPADVPAFAVQTRDDQDGKVHFFDPLSFTGLRRGWRATGINALIEAGRQGKTSGEIADRAVRDFLLTGEHLVAGPPAQFAHTLATGEDALGRHVANRVSTAKTAQGQASAARRGAAPPGSSKYWEHLKAALAGINPIVASMTEKNKTPHTVLEKLTQSAGPFGEKTRDLKKKK